MKNINMDPFSYLIKESEEEKKEENFILENKPVNLDPYYYITEEKEQVEEPKKKLEEKKEEKPSDIPMGRYSYLCGK